jgi:hypothetical protein
MTKSEILNKINDLLEDVESMNESEEELKANLLHRIEALRDSTSSLEDCWDELCDNFDWEKVRSVMLHLNWKWYRTGSAEVPTIKAVKETVKELFQSAWRKRNVLHGTGGFKIIIDSYGRATVEFVVVDWETEEYGAPKL